MLICPYIVNQFLTIFQQDDTFLQYFIPCKRLYIFRVKHVEPFTGDKILYTKSVILLEYF
jgi:hypothetical protein